MGYDYDRSQYFLQLRLDDYYLTQADLDILRKTADKALEWKEIALKNKVEITKEIPNSELVVSSVFLDYFRNTYLSDPNNPYYSTLQFYFSSEKKNKHILRLVREITLQ